MHLLYRGLIGSVLEYGSVCYTGMAKIHMLLLERIQYRALRISMSLMGSTPNNSLGVLSGIPPLRHRLFYLGQDIPPEVGYTRHELGAILSIPMVNRQMEVALSGVHADMYPIVAPLELRAGIALFSPSNLF
jgi:hypothetical protein